ncbi:MAG: TetR/AcrR family transcriptional regulator [Pseudomonadales bacterium]|jgi:TetR/AcrR family transcriptional regulator, cholesterol catabolism regulator|nr:TetR/AcrR family transcriptional regulator [Pseudomonadales bacterium]
MSQLLGIPKGQGVSYGTRKLEVLRSAAILFNERGFHNTTMDDIAAILNVTKPALYYYAKSKDELLYEIGSIALDNTKALLDRIESTENTGLEKLQQFFSGWTQAICGDFGRCLVLTKPESLEANSRKKSKHNRRQIQTRVESIFRSGLKDHSINMSAGKIDARMATMALFDLHNGVAYWFESDSGNDAKLPATEIAEHYWKLFAAGLSSDT